MGILAVVACAEHIKLTMKDFLGESGPSASGKTLCSVQFTWGWPINIPRGGEAAVAITSTTSAIGNNLAGCKVVGELGIMIQSERKKKEKERARAARRARARPFILRGAEAGGGGRRRAGALH